MVNMHIVWEDETLFYAALLLLAESPMHKAYLKEQKVRADPLMCPLYHEPVISLWFMFKASAATETLHCLFGNNT